MKAVLSKEVGGPETLVVENIDEPTPGKGEVLIKVAACAINFPDTLIIRDMYQFKPPRPFAPGGEISGTIEAIGEGVSDFAVGDRVMCGVGNGGLQRGPRQGFSPHASPDARIVAAVSEADQ